ncbi:MAG: hypothetical protein J0I09_01095 [Sphingobacteriia bacterium]|nr:hypothetical protein [Sphingobacteriia bacterium]
MSKILKISSILWLFIVFSLSAQSQIVKLPKVLIFGNGTYASPSGNFANLYDTGLGFEIGGGLGLGRNLLYASTGYISYHSISSNTAGKMNVAPVKIGLRHYILGGLFVNGAVGTAVQNFDNASNNGSSFLYEVGAGFKVLGLIELGAAYQGYKLSGTSVNANALLLKAGLALKL